MLLLPFDFGKRFINKFIWLSLPTNKYINKWTTDLKHSHDNIALVKVITESTPCHLQTLNAFSLLLTLVIWSKFSFNYTIKDGNEKGYFQIDENSGLITTAASLDRNATRSFHLSVVAENVNDTCHKGLMVVKVIVLEKIDTKPKFEKSQYSVNVREDVVVNHRLIKVSFFNNFIRTQSRYF